MRAIVIFLIFLALFAAGGTAFLAKRFLDNQKQAQTEQKDPGNTEKTMVVVANSNLSVGAVLKSSSLKWVAWPAESISDTYTSAARKNAKLEKNFIGKVLRHSVLEGTPLTQK